MIIRVITSGCWLLLIFFTLTDFFLFNDLFFSSLHHFFTFFHGHVSPGSSPSHKK
jgi:hypothetical protein